MNQQRMVRKVAVAIRVNIEDLVSSGTAVTGHGEDVAMKHTSADSRIESAQLGWQGRSAGSMATRLAAWSTTTAALLTQMSDHAQNLHSCAQEFCAMEERHAELLKIPGQQAESIARQM
ncbi:MAG: WXG100 family type VII secretion target [Mycobacterium sp.]